MMKKILCLLMAMLILAGCGASRQKKHLADTKNKVISITEKKETAEVMKKETAEVVYDWQMEFTEEMFQNLPDVPDWNSANAKEAFLEGYKPSDEVLSVYNHKKETGELIGDYLELYYHSEEINYVPPYYDEEFAKAMFKQNGCLITGHYADRKIVMTYSDGHNEEIELDVIPKHCILLTTVSVYEGGHYKEVFEGFSICYDQSTSEVVCVRFDEEIGKRVKVSFEDIEEFLNDEDRGSYCLSIGYINHNDELVYPTIVEDETGIRFELLKKLLKVQKEQLIYFTSAIVDNINFRVWNNNIYIIDNVKRRVCLDGHLGFCYGIWTTGEAKIRENPIDFSLISNMEIEILPYYQEKCCSVNDVKHKNNLNHII